jgi:hypothetical protein
MPAPVESPVVGSNRKVRQNRFAMINAALLRLGSIPPRYQRGWKSAGKPAEFQLHSPAQAGKDFAPGSARFEAIASGWDTSPSVEPF